MDNINIVKLRSISNEIELNMIKAILDDNSIPYIIKNHGAGGHMRIISGSSQFATDIMVAEYDIDRAKSLLESISID
ncbi:MAG: putative signal transducing protein [Tissierella sp.]|uniref:putative signal transducing protein n=1 Tax=Tissierella sp. TaxID=41274 RepID=UPI003F94FC7B